ncbi:MAG: class SAM-dependent methyltransferase [Deltaproteobacteria bacterium]|nr:class SAM-dependent methyltransferase [Deltaproteobacteria bacterium]
MKNTIKNKGIENKKEPVKDKYRIVGPLYDFLSNLYSGRSIHHCKIAMINKDNVKKGDRILFAGVGHGLDAIQAAELGANVTVVDISETMLNQFRQKLKKNNPKLKIRQVHSDILEFNEFKKYDMVVANFFLNVFYQDMMTRVLEQLVRLGKPGAKIVVGDFSYPTGNIFSRAFKVIYWYGAVLFFWLFARNAVHNIYNYPEFMENAGLVIKEKKYYKLGIINCYWSVLGEKSA